MYLIIFILLIILISALFLYDRPIGTRKPKTDSYENLKNIKPPNGTNDTSELDKIFKRN